jgi:hypothetical protein
VSLVLPQEIAPIPGDAGGIRRKADRFTRTADAILDAVETLRTSIAQTRNHTSEALDVLAENAGSVSDQLSSLEGRYRVAGSALGGFGDALETAQAEANAIVGQSAQTAPNLAYYDRQIAIYTDQRATTTDPTELAEVTRHLTGLHSRRNTIQGDLTELQSRFDRIVEGVRSAGIDAAGRLQDAIGGDGLNDSLWDDISGWVHENAEILKAIHQVMQWVTTGLAILSLFIPVLAPFALAAAILTAGLSLVLAATGEISWVDFALDRRAVARGGGAAAATRTIAGVMTALKGTRVARLGAQGVSSPLRVVTGSFNGVLKGTKGAQLGGLQLPSLTWAKEIWSAKGIANAHFLRVAELTKAGASGPLDDILLAIGRQEMAKITIANAVRTGATQIDATLNERIPQLLELAPDALADSPVGEMLSGISEGYQDIRDSATWRVGS